MSNLTSEQLAEIKARIAGSRPPFPLPTPPPAPPASAPNLTPAPPAPPAVEKTALDFVDVLGGRGFVVDEALARESPCLAFEVGSRRLVYARGVVGALDSEQQALYCETTEARPLTEREEENLSSWRRAAESCQPEAEQFPAGERLQPFLTCIQRERRRREQESGEE